MNMRKLSEVEKHEKYLNAEDAIRDILYMYYVCLEYNCLFDDFGTEDGKFDPYIFIDCTVNEVGYDIDYKILHEGSAIKLACKVLQAWGQGGYTGIDSKGLEDIKALVKTNRMAHITELKEFIELALVSYERAQEKANEVFTKFVVGYFRELTK